MSKETTNVFAYQIKRIKCISFKINEDIPFQTNPPLMINLSYLIKFNKEKSYIDFVLGINYAYDNVTEKCLQFDIQNRFSIDNINQYINTDDDTVINLPTNALVSMLSLSVTHARAIIGQHIEGTIYSEGLMPITNTFDLAKQFFGESVIPTQPVQ